MLAPPAHGCGLGDKCPQPGEVVPSQGDMGSSLLEHPIMMDQGEAKFAKQQHIRRYPRVGWFRSTSVAELSMVGTTSRGSRISLLPAPHVPHVNGRCNLAASPSTRCTLKPDRAIAEQGSSDSSPHGDSCLT